MTAYQSFSNFIEGLEERYLQLFVIMILIASGIAFGHYSDGFERPSSTKAQLEGVEHDQHFNDGSHSEVYIVELVNGSRHYYWDTEERTDRGFIEVSSELSLFSGNESNYAGLDFRPQEKVCAREISNTDIDLYRC